MILDSLKNCLQTASEGVIMDKKILFKSIVATVSAVVVFLLSFSTVLSEPKNIEVSAEQVSIDDVNNRSSYMVSPFYGLSLYVLQDNPTASVDDVYFDGFSLPKFLTNYSNDTFYPSGEYLGVTFRDGYLAEYRDYYYGLESRLHRTYLTITKPFSREGYSDNIFFRGDNFTLAPNYLALFFGSYISGDFENTDAVSLGFKFNGNESPSYIDFTINIVLQSKADPFYDLSLAFDQQNLRFRIYPDGNGWFWFRNAYLSTEQLPTTSFPDFYLANFLNDSNKVNLIYDGFYRCRVFDLRILVPYSDYSSVTAEFLDLTHNASLGTGFSNLMNMHFVNADEIFKVDYNHWYDYWDVYNEGYRSGFDGNFDFFRALFNSVSDFLAIEIFPGFTLSSTLFLVFGLSFLFFVLKVFLGG